MLARKLGYHHCMVHSISWLFLSISLLAASLALGQEACWELVDSALFIVLFLSTLRRHGVRGAGMSLYMPAALVTASIAFRNFFLNGSAGEPMKVLLPFMRFGFAALLMLIVLAATAKSSPRRRLYNSTTVGGFAWFLGGVFYYLAGIAEPASTGRYLGANLLVGVIVGFYSVLVSIRFVKAQQGDGEPSLPAKRAEGSP